MAYHLMHKNTKVLSFKMNDGHITSLLEIYNEYLIPLGAQNSKGKLDLVSLKAWWNNRVIPMTRMNYNDIMKTLNVNSSLQLAEYSLGVSLSDHYWICPRDKDIQWEDINYYDNDYSMNIGNILLGSSSVSIDDFFSPDTTTDGWLKKKWETRGEKHYLLKSGSGNIKQEPYNEIIASMICHRLGWKHIPYTIDTINNEVYCLCENFITKDSEFINAWDMMKKEKKPNNISWYQHYKNCTKDIIGIEESLNQMILLDYLTMNEDRHFGNFGILRDANTLEYLGPTPIFDTGSSLGFRFPTNQMNSLKVPCKPFKTTHNEQLKLITSFDYFSSESLKDIEKEIELFLLNNSSMDKERIMNICKGIGDRIAIINEFKEKYTLVDDLNNDVQEHSKYAGEDNEKEGC